MPHSKSDRALTQFLARLASLPDWLEIADERTKEQFLRERRRFPSGVDLLPRPERSALASEFVRFARELIPSGPSRSYVLRKGLGDLHALVRRIVRDLLDGRRVDVELRRSLMQLKDGVLDEKMMLVPPYDPSFAAMALYFELLRVIRRPPFPFGECARCGAIFARAKRQRFCSPVCASRSLEESRKESKREYMRKYMAERRSRQRRAALKRMDR